MGEGCAVGAHERRRGLKAPHHLRVIGVAAVRSLDEGGCMTGDDESQSFVERTRARV